MLSTPCAADLWPGQEGAAEGRAAGRGVALYASRCRHRAWPGGGGRAADGRAAGWGVCFLRLSQPTSGLAWRGQWRAACVLPWRGVCFSESIFHSLASRPCPPDHQMGWGKLAPLLCERNLLGRSCGAGWVNKDTAGNCQGHVPSYWMSRFKLHSYLGVQA